ncbi:MAG: glycogen debranching enzyme N-terminal domain-containing protein, partial [Acidobacteria bacterium]|nr:glycogen debranching enzyme N-terminal domain-containing protein [Acidobacteriota bacterium]
MNTQDLRRSIDKPLDAPLDEEMQRREWLVTNGLGGYASGTVAGVVTRRYHGLLVASLPAPLGRVVMLNHLLERVRIRGSEPLWLGDEDEVAGPNAADRSGHLAEFRLELGLPVWRYEVGGIEIERRVLMPHGQNTVHVTYRLISGVGPVRLTLRPSVHFRGYEAPVDASSSLRYTVNASHDGYELLSSGEFPPMRLVVHGPASALTLDVRGKSDVPYAMEASRGYQSVGALWSPGYFRADLLPDQPVTLVASTESWKDIHGLPPPVAAAAEQDRRRSLLAIAGRTGGTDLAAELVLAADQFIITPAGRAEEAARARAAGEDVRTVIAGYHWFTDWGRDTMISLEGLTLATGRFREAGYILKTFGHYVRDGLIPNMFPDGSREGLYHTADATLWYFHAVQRYVQTTGETETLRRLLPTFLQIARRHIEGTRFGIQVDPADGLLRQGAEGYQLTWMDAKVDDWVVTPRRGKAVEINALWYNALRLLDGWLRAHRLTDEGLDIAGHALRARDSFNRRFWSDTAGHLLDVVDGEQGDDAACRPNQILAISLDHPVLVPERWETVMRTVRERLLTPVGL